MAMPRHNGKWYDGAILCQTEAWLCRNPLWISKSHNDGMAQKGPSEPQPSWRGIAPSKNVCAYGTLHCLLDVAHADALAALFPGNENDGRGQGILVAGLSTYVNQIVKQIGKTE